LCERARESGALAVLGGALLVAADVAFRLGQWDLADEQMREATRVTAETGHPSLRGLTLTTHSRLLAARGAEDEARSAALTALGLAEADGIRAGLRHVHAALGFLELSSDRIDEAIRELETVARLVDRRGLEEPTNLPWRPDLVEAYARAGRMQDAQGALDALVPQAAASRNAVAGAAAARCRGMLEHDFDGAFAEALALHDQRPMPFERARTLLAFGRRLHRARRRAEARERLREALDGFERIGADAWARQTRHELRAAGGRMRRPVDGNVLSPQELRVAAAVGRGASNREIASELFLAPKTIEFHLRQIYQKLGVRSRPALVAALAGGAAEDRASPAHPETPASP
jgi:ATP/maltotriose-dependent transcriptional regulator MalT